nr:hypothetical protein HmN_000332500 [Hymenolepis microstoma]
MSDTILLHNSSNLISEEIKLFQKPPTGRSVSSRRNRVTSSDGEDKLVKDRNGTRNSKCDNIVDDSGFQSNLSGESLEHCEISQDNDDPNMKFMQNRMSGRESHHSSAAPSPRPSRTASRSASRHVTSTPIAQVRRRSSSTIPSPSGPSLSLSRAPSIRMTSSVTQDYCTTGRKRTSQCFPESLVAQTVAERRARAEALDAERRRKHQAKLEASEAALQAACQRARSLRAARSAELRSKEEEKRARVTERRKMLEKHREEFLNRRILKATNSQSQEFSSQHAPSRVSICGFSSDLDPSDPRYCPFGFGSSSRRDVCLSTKQQLIASKPHQAINRLSNSMTTNSLSRLNKTSSGMISSMHTVGRGRSANLTTPRSLKERNRETVNSKANSVSKASNQSTLNRCNTNKELTYPTPNGNNIKPSKEVTKTSHPAKAAQQPTEVSSNTSCQGIPPRPGSRGRPQSVRSIKNTSPSTNLSQSNIERKSVGRGSGPPTATPRCPPISVSAGCEPSEADAQAYRERIKEQRRIARERKRLEEEEAFKRFRQREEEVNKQMEEMARSVVNEAISYAIAELKAEAAEASKTISGNETVACKAAKYLAHICTVNGVKRGDSKDVVDSALSTSKKVLNNAIEDMTLSANTECPTKSQSEILNVLSNAASDISGREKRRARLDVIMNRVRTNSETSALSNGHDKSIAPLTIAVSCVNDVEEEYVKRYRLKPCGAIKSMLEKGRLPGNCKAAVLLRNRIAKYEQVSPIELCSPFSETSNTSELETGTVIEHSPSAHVVEKSPNSPNDSGNEQDSREGTDWNTSSTSTTVAVCFPLNRRIQPDELFPSQHSSCSDVSTNSGPTN